MDLLQSTDFWVSISFVIFCFICWRFGKQAFTNMLDSRISSIKEELEAAESLRVEAQELLAQYQRKHRDAVKEAEEIVAVAQRHTDEILAGAEKDLKDLTARREKQLEERLERLEQSAINDIQKHAADLAIRATTEIIADKLDKKTNEKLVDESIKSLSSNIH